MNILGSRFGGVLLHPTSLPGEGGIGELGESAHQWVHWLHAAGLRIWQILPLGPTGYGDSPYQSFSAFAGNASLIDLQILVERGLLRPEDAEFPFEQSPDHIHYANIIEHKTQALSRAAVRFHKESSSQVLAAYEEFQARNANWLKDYALFMALKDFHQGKAWTDWDTPLKVRDANALRIKTAELSTEVNDHTFRQFIFFEQWRALREVASKAGIKIVGDMPIFVAHDSADVWTRPDLFQLRRDGRPSVVAGVPPDYFSKTGQLWGNPLYDWEAHRATNYEWWKARVAALLEIVDVIRIDHFRGFESYWEIRAGNKTAEVGKWIKAPGAELFDLLSQELGELPIIAEDLGLITEEVKRLRDALHFPGMKILQFAFEGDEDNHYLPHRYPRNCVVYTGTHDNDTARGWYAASSKQVKHFSSRYLNTKGEDIAWDLIRAAWASTSNLAIAPMQDFLRLGSEARMNTPSKAGGNWTWRLRSEELSSKLADNILELNRLYGRNPQIRENKGDG